MQHHFDDVWWLLLALASLGALAGHALGLMIYYL